MAATQSPIIPKRSSPSLVLPPKPSPLTNGALPILQNDNKKLPPLPTKPKPPLSQRASHLNQRISADSRFDTDSSSDTFPHPVLRNIPITKKLSLDSAIPMSTNSSPLLPVQILLSPTRSTSNLCSHAPPLKPKPTQTTPSPSPPASRRGNTEVPVLPLKARTDSPIVAPKPLFPLSHKLPHSTPCDTNSEDSGIFISPDKSLPELPPKLPARPQKSHSEKSLNYIVVPKKELRMQRWTTNTSDLPPPVPNKLPSSDDKTRSSSEVDTMDDKTKIHRTLPSRHTKKKRPLLLHRTDMLASDIKPSTPPPVCKSQISIQTDSLNSNLLHVRVHGRFERSHSFDSLESAGSGNFTDSSGRTANSNNGLNSRKKSNASTNQEAKKGKMKRALLKALGVTKKDSNSGIEPSTSLPVSLSNPAINAASPELNSMQSVPARVSRALNMGLSKDDSFVFENVSDTETESRAEVAKLSYDSANQHTQLPAETSCSLNSPLRHKRTSPSKRSLNSQQPSTPTHFQYSDFPYVFENSNSDSDSLSDVEAFDDFDDILNDSDNEMTEEQLNKAKLRTIARTASGAKLSKCYYVAKELLSTEETYVRKLKLLHVDFSHALEEAGTRNGKVIVPDDTLKKIFSNLPELYQINSAFRDELKTRLDSWSSLSPEEQNIGDIMKKHAHFFKAYSPFISNFDNALKLLDELSKKNSSFCSLLYSFQALPKCGSLPVSAHLLDIVQRIPRYKLLLEQYIKYLPEESGDREDSEKALTIITEVAVHVNENLRMMDNFNKMIEVLNKIDGDVDNLIVPSRQFVKGGELKKVCRKGLQVRAFFLFTDVLLHTSPGTGSSNYSLHTRIPLAGMKVSDLEEGEDLSKNDPLKHGFKIISAIRSFVVVAASQEEKEEWLSVLNKSLFELRDKMISHAKTNNRTSIFLEPALLGNSEAALGSLAPVWIPDDSVSMCMMCYNKFTFARRRHHCRVCGKVLCGPCSDFKAAIKYIGDKQARCCLSCYEQLTGGEPGPSTPATVDLDPVSSISETANTSDNANRIQKRTRLRKERSLVPAHLIQVTSEVDYRMRGNLEYSENSPGKFKNSRWVVLQDTVLFIYKKREDAVAMLTVPILGYEIDDITNTVFALRHRNVQNRFFRAENKESAEKWRKELAKVLSGNVENLASSSSLEDPQVSLMRFRSATTGQVHSTEHGETARNQQTQSTTYPNKCYSDELTSQSVDMTKMSAPTSSAIEYSSETEPGESEDLTETIKEQSSVECKN